jgi:hypothetical protein
MLEVLAMARKDSNHFVEDGCERARAASIDTIRAEVQREFAERLASAGWWERVRLRYAMRREIKKRLDRVAPPWGLYSSATP